MFPRALLRLRKNGCNSIRDIPRHLNFSFKNNYGLILTHGSDSTLGAVHSNQKCAFKTASFVLGGDVPSDSSSIKKEDVMRRKIEQDEEVRSILDDILSDFEVPEKSPALERSDTAPDKDDHHDENHPSDQSGEKKVIFTSKSKFQVYRDEDSPVILDVTEQQQLQLDDLEFYPHQEKVDAFEDVEFQRGVKGVFDIEELVEILKQENLRDIAVISIPKKMVYADFMVLATAFSPRHSRAVSEFMKKLYKKKKSKEDPFIHIEGEENHDWKAIDMGNIVLHIFLEETRQHYDIETLWTVGESYDNQIHKSDDPVFDFLEQQIKFLQEAQPLTVSENHPKPL